MKKYYDTEIDPPPALLLGVAVKFPVQETLPDEGITKVYVLLPFVTDVAPVVPAPVIDVFKVKLTPGIPVAFISTFTKVPGVANI